MEKSKDLVAIAMKHLGTKGKVTVTHIGFSNYRVVLNGAYFGIFDTVRNTFVD